MRYAPDLITWEQVNRGHDWQENDKDEIIGLIHYASEFLQRRTDKVFVPYAGSEVLDARGTHIRARLLLLNGDWLSFSAVTNGDATAVAADDFFEISPEYYPRYGMEIKQASSLYWTYQDDWRQAIRVEGTLGFVEHYPDAFENVTTLTASLNTTATLIPVADTAGIDTLVYLKAGNELMQATGIDTPGTPGTLIVLRARQGTVAETHSATGTLQRFVQSYDVQRNCERVVSYMYERRDIAGGGRIQFADGGSTLTDFLPSEVQTFIKDYSRKRIRG